MDGRKRARLGQADILRSWPSVQPKLNRIRRVIWFGNIHCARLDVDVKAVNWPATNCAPVESNLVGWRKGY